MASAAVADGYFGRLVEYSRRRPATVLMWLLGLHLLVWTVTPILLSRNLQLDLVEGLALGREWQLGYWKHPPLPWWIADLAYRATGQIATVYVLGPLSAVICFYAVWLLARDIVGELKGLIAVAALQGIHYYNISVVKFAHDQMQLPLWALTGLFCWRAIVRGRLTDWMLAGLFLAGAFWSKYSVFALAATLGLVLLFDPLARRSWRTPGPYVMAAVFAVVVAPNVWWLVTHDFLPLRYIDDRAVAATRWYHFVVFPLRWTAEQTLILLPAVAVLALLYGRRRSASDPAAAVGTSFDRRYVAALAAGPFVVTTVIAAALGRQPITLWGYPLWTFAPLAVLMLFPPALDPIRLRRFAAGALATFVAFPLALVAVEIGEPLLHDRLKATQFPGRLLADTITQRWRDKTGSPLVYVGGAIIVVERNGILRELPAPGEFSANNVAVYSPDRPHVIVKGELKRSPWIDPADVERRGVVLLWQPVDQHLPENLRRAFPRAELQPPLALPRQTYFFWPSLRPEIVHYAIVLPRP